MRWQIQEAKQRFSELLRAAEDCALFCGASSPAPAAGRARGARHASEIGTLRGAEGKLRSKVMPVRR